MRLRIPEPGSTVKPFVVLTALQRGAARHDEVINIGSFTVSGKEIVDVAPRPQQTLDEILINSSKPWCGVVLHYVCHLQH